MATLSKPVINVGFIGTGDISNLHAAAVKQCPGATLAGVWNRTPATCQKKAAEFGCKAYASPADLCNDPAIDAIFVLTNLETHCEYTLMALNAGKHVLVEKPVGVSIAEIESMNRLATAKGLVCMPGHNYIYESSMQRSRELIESGDLGTIVSAYVMYNIHHSEEIASRYPGVVRSILTHHSYMLLYLVGAPVELCAMKATLHYKTFQEEDVAMMQMRLKNGALAHFCASFAADDHAGDPWTVMVKVIGTGGSTRYSYRDHVELKPGTVHSQTYTAYRGSVMNEVRHLLVDCLRHDASPLSTMSDAITCQKMIEAAEESIRTGSVVKMPV
jgi:predicted dehydrogenase